MTRRWFFLAFVAGIFCGILAFAAWREEWIYRIPYSFLTFQDTRAMHAVSSLYTGSIPKNGKIIYIFGGSAAHQAANPVRLSRILSEKMGYPVEIRLISNDSQSLVDTLGMIDALPRREGGQNVYVVLTWSAYRFFPGSSAVPTIAKTIDIALAQNRLLFRNDRLRYLIGEENILDHPFAKLMTDSSLTGKAYLQYMDRKYGSSVFSRWFKGFLYDKAVKLKQGRWRYLFYNPPPYAESDYDDSTMANIRLAFQNRDTLKDIRRNHARYLNDFLAYLKFYNREDQKRILDFSIYMIADSVRIAHARGYHFVTLQLPLHEAMYKEPLINDVRSRFQKNLVHLARRENFPNYYTTGPIPALSEFVCWWDAGHMTLYGAKIYEPMLVNVLADMLRNGKGGDYGF